MVRNENADDKDWIMKVHTSIFAASIGVPVVLQLTGLISTKQCISFVGIGFFILSGHALAYHRKYLEYLKAQDVAGVLTESGAKKLLTASFGFDLFIAVFLYVVGTN